MMEGCYIQVIVPLRLFWTPWYRCPVPVAPGQRVTVALAGRKYVGVVQRTAPEPDIDPSKVQPVVRVNDDLPEVSEQELRFWEFLSSYYLCSAGEVYKAAYPAGKIRSEQTAADILSRLEQRLAIREEALKRKHRDDVRERLEAERASLRAQIAALTRVPPEIGSSEGARQPGKPLLLVGRGRIARYMEECRTAVGKGLNVLILVPEIKSSDRLSTLFGEEFPGITHSVNSHITETRRRRVADDVRRFGGQIVIGTRSSVFLPFSRLGLVIVEQEQDVYYKQTEPAPRYNARDAAVVLARIHGAQVVLGTPAPSLESFHNALAGKYLREDLPGPSSAMTLIDISAERRKRGMTGSLSILLARAAATVSGPIALVRGWEKPDELAADAGKAFPGRQVDILSLSESRQRDLQPYALVAVVQADALMQADDFRSDEHALQAIAQLRETCSGLFVVQTAKAEHPVFGEPSEVYARLLEERRSFGLPPFTRLVDIICGERRERVALPSDGTLQARKQKILGDAQRQERSGHGRLRTKIDVDPL